MWAPATWKSNEHVNVLSPSLATREHTHIQTEDRTCPGHVVSQWQHRDTRQGLKSD